MILGRNDNNTNKAQGPTLSPFSWEIEHGSLTFLQATIIIASNS